MSVPTFVADAVETAYLRLGESARWDPSSGHCSWVDIEAGTLFVAPGLDINAQRVLMTVHGTLGCAIPDGVGGFVLANENRVVWFDGSETRTSEEMFPRDKIRRFNDGCIDSEGRLIVGTLSRGRDDGTEKLLRIDREGRVEVLRANVRLSNGVAFHPDGRLFHVDTLASSVSWSDDLSTCAGWMTAFTVDGTPDGLHIGADGTLWLAMWGGGEVRQYTEYGELLARVVVDADNVTSCARIGTDGHHLLVTTARDGLSARELEMTPSSGQLFVADITTPTN
jgi:sugar lactone lactonase YvrE